MSQPSKVSRRSVLAASAGTAATWHMSPIANASSSRGQTFVLLHGTWHGGWAWSLVTHHLERMGHKVLAPTCTGCGERNHLIGPEVNLSTHIQDVVNAVRFAEVGEFVLVGHSFAGLTMTGVADRLHEQIKHLVYFDALIPRAGRMAAVTRDPATGEFPAWWSQRAASFQNGYEMSFWSGYDLDMLVPRAATNARERLKRLLTTHPAGQWTEKLKLTNGGWEPHRRTFVHCVGQTYNPSSEAMYAPARKPGWRFETFNAPRDAMLTHPKETAELLASIVG